MKKQISFILGLLSFAVIVPALAYAVQSPSGPQHTLSVTPGFDDHGNTFRMLSSTPTSVFAIPISSSADNAALDHTTNLGIGNYRGRYVVNLCTAAKMAIVPVPPSTRTYDTFRATYTIVLASAPANTDGTLIGNVGGTNSIWLYNQAELWAIWDTGATKCIYGASVMEEFYLPPGDDGRLRAVSR